MKSKEDPYRLRSKFVEYVIEKYAVNYFEDFDFCKSNTNLLKLPQTKEVFVDSGYSFRAGRLSFTGVDDFRNRLFTIFIPNVYEYINHIGEFFAIAIGSYLSNKVYNDSQVAIRRWHSAQEGVFDYVINEFPKIQNKEVVKMSEMILEDFVNGLFDDVEVIWIPRKFNKAHTNFWVEEKRKKRKLKERHKDFSSNVIIL